MITQWSASSLPRSRKFKLVFVALESSVDKESRNCHTKFSNCTNFSKYFLLYNYYLEIFQLFKTIFLPQIISIIIFTTPVSFFLKKNTKFWKIKQNLPFSAKIWHQYVMVIFYIVQFILFFRALELSLPVSVKKPTSFPCAKVLQIGAKG